MIIREILVEPQSIAWLPWAVSYFFFVGLAFSSVFVGVWLSRTDAHIRNEFIAITLALICAIVAPIALTADLHQPSRIANFYLHPTAWSWMAWGALFLPLFTVFIGGYFLCLMRQVIDVKQLPKLFMPLYWGKFNLQKWTRMFRGGAALFSVLILLYSTMEVFDVTARPLWHQNGLMLLILCSVLPSAFFLCLFVIQLIDPKFKPSRFRYLSLTCLAIFVATLIWLYFHHSLTAHQLTQLWRATTLPMWLIICLAGIVILLFLPNTVWITSLLLAISLCFTWIFRWILLIQVQGIPKYSASVGVYHLTWQVDGAIGILAMFSLWVFISIVFWQFFLRTLKVLPLKGENNG